MDIQKEEVKKKEWTRFGVCSDSTCDGKSHILDECVRCLNLFCPDHVWLTPKGGACVDCYSALFPESMFSETLNWLSKVH